MENQEMHEASAPVQAPVEAPEQQAAEMIKITFSRKLAKAFTTKTGKTFRIFQCDLRKRRQCL